MLRSITGTISACTIKKEGITNNRSWKIFAVVINGEQFSTFDAAFAEHIGQNGTFEYDETTTPDGQYVNKTLSKYPETVINAGTSATPTGSADIGSIIRGLGILRGDIQRMEKSLDERLSRLASAIASISSPPSPETPVTPEMSSSPAANNSPEGIPIINETPSL